MSEETDLEEDDLSLEDTSPGEEEQDEKKKHRRLTEAEKIAIRDQFERGQKRMIELADEYEISRQSLHKWFKKDDIKWGVRAHELKAVAAAAEEKVAERYAEKRMQWIEETRIAAYKDLDAAVRLAKKIVADAVRSSAAGGGSYASHDDNMKFAQRFNKVLRENYETRLNILDANNVVDKNDLPVLKIDDLTAEQILDFHRNNGIDNEDELSEILKNFEEAKLDGDE